MVHSMNCGELGKRARNFLANVDTQGCCCIMHIYFGRHNTPSIDAEYIEVELNEWQILLLTIN